MKTTLALLLVIALTCCKHNASKATSSYTGKAKKSKRALRNTNFPAFQPDSLDIKIGQMILVGINDRTTLSDIDPLRYEILTQKVGGIILFEKNIAKTESKQSLQNLIADLQTDAQRPLFISIDEEGGKVHRLKEKYGFVSMPSAAYLGSFENVDSTTYYTRSLASQLAELGINLNFAPDVDLALNKDNPVIVKAGRSYSEDPKVVSTHAMASIQAHHRYGVKTILKHFPGHGSSSTDSHFGITDVSKQWQFSELTPYKDIIGAGMCDAVMTAHIINCRLDTACLPATLSKTIINDILRNFLEFKGVVFSDDMQMHAISKQYGLEQSIKMAINAGVDVLLFGNNVNLNDRIQATEIHAMVKKMVLDGDISESRINESYSRILKLKGNFAKPIRTSISTQKRGRKD